MRDPVMYRIVKPSHYRTGDEWCIYPMYDFAHGQSDSIEGITHSLCTSRVRGSSSALRLVPPTSSGCHHRARGRSSSRGSNLTHTVLSKRKLRLLVEEGHVAGWDDPRMPTLCGLPPPRLHAGVDPRRSASASGSRRPNSTVDMALLEHTILRSRLNRTAPRVMGVLRPLKVVIENYPGGGRGRSSTP